VERCFERWGETKGDAIRGIIDIYELTIVYITDGFGEGILPPTAICYFRR
jgi:hypothetical protein